MQLKKSEILPLVPESKRRVAKGLIDELKFISETLGTLKEIIRREGPEEVFENGRQHFTRERPAMNSYQKFVGRESMLLKQLCDLMGCTPVEKNELMAFLKDTE